MAQDDVPDDDVAYDDVADDDMTNDVEVMLAQGQRSTYWVKMDFGHGEF